SCAAARTCVLTTGLSGRPQCPCRGQTRPTMPHGPLQRVVRLPAAANEVGHSRDDAPSRCPKHHRRIWEMELPRYSNVARTLVKLARLRAPGSTRPEPPTKTCADARARGENGPAGIHAT